MDSQYFSFVSGALKYLANLDLSKNNLQCLPENFGNFGFSLKYLNLRENALERLPSSFAKLVATKHIDISYNALTELPAASTTETSFGRDLADLNLSQNKLSSVDGWFNAENGFTKLENLDLSNNQLESIHDESMKKM